MGEVKVRRGVETDWEQSRTIRLRALCDAPLAFASTYGREISFEPEQWRERIATSAQFLAEDTDGEVIGTASGLVDPERSDTVLLVAMFVVAEARRTGVGEQLVRAVVSQAREDGASRVRLHVVETNDGAARLYARCGFARTGVTEPLPHRPELLEHEMILDLT